MESIIYNIVEDFFKVNNARYFYIIISLIHLFLCIHKNIIVLFLFCIILLAFFGDARFAVYFWNIFFLAICFVYLINFTVRYLNNHEFKEKYPLLNIFITIVLAGLLLIIVYLIIENMNVILHITMHEINKIIIDFIYKMMHFSQRPSNPSGPGPAGGGGQDPGKGPGGGQWPFGYGSDKSTDYDSASDEDSLDNSTNNQHNEPKKGTRFKYTGDSVPGEPEQWEIEEEKKTRKKASSIKYEKSIQGKKTRTSYKASKKYKESNALYEASKTGKETRTAYNHSEAGEESRAVYNDSILGRETRAAYGAAYRASPEGKEAIARSRANQKAKREAKKLEKQKKK